MKFLHLADLHLGKRICERSMLGSRNIFYSRFWISPPNGRCVRYSLRVMCMTVRCRRPRQLRCLTGF